MKTHEFTDWEIPGGKNYVKIRMAAGSPEVVPAFMTESFPKLWIEAARPVHDEGDRFTHSISFDPVSEAPKLGALLSGLASPRILTFSAVESKTVLGVTLSRHTQTPVGDGGRTPVGEMVYRAKYQGDATAASALAQHMADLVRAIPVFMLADRVAAAPSSTATSKRGNRLPRHLVTEICKATGLTPAVDLLRCVRVIPQMKEMTDFEAKKQALAGAFQVDAQSGKLSGLRVLLVDDICDHGTTLEEATKVLMQAGAGSVMWITGTKTWAGGL